MDIQQINQILNLVEKTNFIEVEVEQDGLRIKARKDVLKTKPETGVDTALNHIIVRSQWVGIFNASLVDVGDLVKKGQVLCTINTLGLTNEVETKVNGRIVFIYIKNDQPVEYGEPLFVIEPSEEVNNVH